MFAAVRSALVSACALAFGLLGFGLSVIAIAVQWLPISSFIFHQPPQAIESPITVSIDSVKAARRRSAPAGTTSAPTLRRRSSKRPTSVPADGTLPPTPTSSRRRVYFADSPKSASSRNPRVSFPTDQSAPIKPILNAPDSPQTPVRPTYSPRSSLSSISTFASTLAQSSGIISLNDPEDAAHDSDSSARSHRASFSYLPRIPLPKLYNPVPLPKLYNPLANRRKSGSISSTGEGSVASEKEADKPATPTSSTSDAQPGKSSRRSSLNLNWNYPWSARRPSSAGQGSEAPSEDPSGTDAATKSTGSRRVSRAKSVQTTPDDVATVTTTTTTSTSVVSIVSASYFTKKQRRRTSTPAPRTRTEPYVAAAFATMDDDPPPYVKSAATDPLCAEQEPIVTATPSDIDVKKERNAKAQAALGVGGGRRPPPRRAVTYAG